jgi:hypothetical protein
MLGNEKIRDSEVNIWQNFSDFSLKLFNFKQQFCFLVVSAMYLKYGTILFQYLVNAPALRYISFITTGNVWNTQHNAVTKRSVILLYFN